MDGITFTAAMVRLGPFETRPDVAVAVSGGADSVALTLLTADWARRRGGHAIALTVDHGLRAESAREAQCVGAWMTTRGIVHHTLHWRGPKAKTNVQARARDARYRLLTDWCRKAGILHLATAHTRDDQAETVLMRLARGSGDDGGAGIAAIVERQGVRLIRPLLSADKNGLRAYLRGLGQQWLEDPSNRDPTYDRTHTRAIFGGGRAPNDGVRRIADAADGFAAARIAIEPVVATLLAKAVRLSPGGYALVDPGCLEAAPRPIAERALARILTTVGGRHYGPRGARLARTFDTIFGSSPHACTLGGCRLTPFRGRLLVSRELAAVGADVTLSAGVSRRWDDRFVISITDPSAVLKTAARHSPRPQTQHVTIAALGARGPAAMYAQVPRRALARIPAPARASLPALWDLDGLVALPHLSYWRDCYVGWRNAPFTARFRPPHALAGPVFGGH